MPAAKWGTWWSGSDRDPHTCPTHGVQNGGPVIYSGEFPQVASKHLCAECLGGLVQEFAGGPELPVLNAPRG